MNAVGNKIFWALGITLLLLVAAVDGGFDPTIMADAWIIVAANATSLNVTANATDGGQLNDVNGYLNYTIYNFTGYNVTVKSLEMYWNGSLWNATNVDISGLLPGDYYVCVNATNASSGNWSNNNSNWFAVGDLAVTYFEDYVQNLSEVTFFVNATHVDHSVDNITGNVNYLLVEDTNLNGTMKWNGSLWSATADFSSLVPADYNLRINATHYNLLNVTDVSFTVQNLSGVVLDASDLTPVEAAQVAFMNATDCAVSTDSNGSYSMEIVNFSSFVPWINVTHSLYRTNIGPWSETVELSGNTHLYGVVTNIRTGAPIEGALLKVINTTGDVIYNATVNSSGHYDLWMSGDFNYTVNVSHQAYIKVALALQEANSSSSESRLDISLYDLGWGSVTAVVTDVVNGRPIPDALVRVVGVGGSQGMTGNDGQVMLFVTGDINSDYWLDITHPDYDDKLDSAFFSVLEGQNVIKSYPLAGTSVVEGYVRDQYNQKLIGNVFVQLLEHGTSNRFGYDNAYYYNTSADANGYYRMFLPISLLNSTNLYDVQFSTPLYETKVMNKDDVGYHGSQQVDATLAGLLQVGGVVVDDLNDEPIQGANVSISEIGGDFAYNVQTNVSGQFLLRIRNNTLGYTVETTKAGYEQNTTSENGSVMLNIRLSGSAVVQGRLVDKYKDNNVTTIPISLAEVNLIVDGAVLHNTTSDANGYFSFEIQDGVSYYLEIKKSGYYAVDTSQYSIARDFGNIELTGKAVISGAVMDAETRKIGSRLLGGVNVTVTEMTHVRSYVAVTDGDGLYSVDIPSGTQYRVAYNVAGYDAGIYDCGGSCTATEGLESQEVELVGSTTVNGTINDEYEQSIKLADAIVLFKNMQDGVDLYQLQTDADGGFSINLGATANYIIVVNRSGYETMVFNGVGGGYFPGIDMILDGSLTGTISVNAKISDFLSRDPVPGAVVKIFDVNQELSTVPRYMASTDIDGEVLIRIDGNSRYKFYAHSHGYPKLVLNNNGNGYTTSQSFDESLMAVFELYVADALNNWPIKNARISAFHFSNQTDFGPYSLNGTVIGIGANCSGQVVAGINVSLTKVSCLDFQNTTGLCFFSANTTSDSGVVSFDKVPVGTYDLVMDGSAVGCAKVVSTLVVNSSMAGVSSVIDYSSHVGDNQLVVHVQNDTDTIVGATVTVWDGPVGSTVATNFSGGSLTGLTDSDGNITFHRMFAGDYNFSVVKAGYDAYESGITIGYGINNKNVVLGDTIAPAYWSVGDNSSSGTTERDIVGIYAYWTDAMELHSAWLETNRTGFWVPESVVFLSGTGAWSNFSFDTTGLGGSTLGWRITGYDSYLNENVTEVNSFNVNEYTSLMVRVMDPDDNSVPGTDVELRNSTGSVVQNSTGHNLVGLTNLSGLVTFTGLLPCTGCSVNISKAVRVGVRLTNETALSSLPRIAADSLDNLYVVWEDNRDGNSEIYYKNHTSLGWGADTRLTNAAGDSAVPHMVLDSGDNLHVVWHDDRDGNYEIYYKNYTSSSGWSSDVRLTNAAGSSLLPHVVADSSNNLHVAWIDGRDSNAEIYYKNYTSSNGWSSDVRLTNDAASSESVHIAVDSSNNLHVVWYDQRDGNAEIYYKNRTSATGWSDDVRLTDDSADSYNPDIVRDSSNSLHVVWEDERDGNKEVYYKNYTSSGGWSNDTRLTVDTSNSNDPRIVRDSGNNLHIVWYDDRDGNDEIYYKNHTSGAGWNSDVKVTNDADTSAYPDIAVDSDDDVHVVWHDDRDGNYEVYYRNYTGYEYVTNSTTFNISWGENLFIEIDPVVPEDPDFGVSGGSVFTVFLEDSFGDYVGGGVIVDLSGAGYFAQEVSADGKVVFDVDGLLDELEYELYVDGSLQGYGIHTWILDGNSIVDGSLTLAVNTTIMRANITDAFGSAVGGADVTVYESDNVTVARDATGETLEGVTDSGGFVTFYRLLPCLNYNLWVDKDGVFNSTSFNISAGENKTVDLDPTPYINVSVGFQNITITVQNSTGNPLQYVAVTLYDYQPQEYATNRTNATGTVVFYDIPDGVYTTEINGNDIGYGDSTVIIRFGRLTFARQKTLGNGRMSVVVDGQVDYYVHVDAPGYDVYDSLLEAVVFSGTYSDNVAALNPEQADIKDSVSVSVNGTATISGIISDKFFNTTSSPKKWLDGAVIKLLEDGIVRYETVAVGSGGGYGNGSYAMRISPFLQDSDPDDPPVNVSYDIEISMDGYLTDKSFANKYSDGQIITKNAELTGDGSVSGLVYDVNTSQLIPSENDGPIVVEIYDELHTLMYTNDTVLGSFFLTINPFYSPYYLDLDTGNYERLPQTISYDGSQSGLKFYLYPLTYGFVNFSVKSGNEPISGANVSYYYSGMGDVRNFVTNGNGFARDFIRGSNITYDLVVNGTHLGYGVNLTTFTVDEGTEKQLNLTLEPTVVNITLLNQDGQGMDGVNVSITGYPEVGTVNGSALFYKVLPGVYDIDFTGIPEYLAILGNDTISVANPGGMNAKIFTVFETRYYVNLTNGSSGIANITMVLDNTTLGSRNSTTNSSGELFFAKVNPGSYLVSFNETELYLAGYMEPAEVIYADVIAGMDRQTGNNKTIVLNSSSGYSMVRVSTGLLGVNVSLWYNNTNYTGYQVTGSGGFVFFKINVSEYNSSLYFRAEKAGYNDEAVGPYNVTGGNITYVDVTMTTAYGSCAHGAITPFCWCGGVLYSSGYCCSGSYQATSCDDGGSSGGSSSSTTTGGGSSGGVVIVDDDPVEVVEDVYDFSVYAGDYYVLNVAKDGSGCVDVPVSISNTGNMMLSDMEMEVSGIPYGFSADFDSLLGVLYPGEHNSLVVRVCSSGGDVGGDSGCTLSVFSGNVRRDAFVTLRIVFESDNILLRLRERLDRLGSILFDIDVSSLTPELKGYYDAAMKNLKDAEDYLESEDYVQAGYSLDEAERNVGLLLDGIEEVPPVVDDAVNWYVIGAVALVLAILSGVLYWFFLRGKGIFSKEPVLPWNLPAGAPVLKVPKINLSSFKIPTMLLKVLGKHDVYYAHSLARKRYLTDVIEKVIELKCPKCGGKIYQNRCVWCGYRVNASLRMGNNVEPAVREDDTVSRDLSKGDVYYTHKSRSVDGRGERFVTDGVERECSKCGGRVHNGKCVWCG